MKTEALKESLMLVAEGQDPGSDLRARAVIEALDIAVTFINGIERLAVAVENYNNQ